MPRQSGRVMQSRVNGGAVDLTVQGDVGPAITVSVPILAGEPEAEFTKRAAALAHSALAHAEHAGRRGSRLAQLASSLSLDFERPGAAVITWSPPVLSGTVPPGTERLLLLLQDGQGKTRELPLTPTARPLPDGSTVLEFSAQISPETPLTLTPVGPEGFLGVEQAVI